MTRRSTKNSGLCCTSRPPRSSASSTIERSRTSRCSLRSRESRASWCLYRRLANASNRAGVGVIAICTNAGSPQAAITVSKRLTGGSGRRSKSSRAFTRLMNSAVLLQTQDRRRDSDLCLAPEAGGNWDTSPATRPRPSARALADTRSPATRSSTQRPCGAPRATATPGRAASAATSAPAGACAAPRTSSRRPRRSPRRRDRPPPAAARSDGETERECARSRSAAGAQTSAPAATSRAPHRVAAPNSRSPAPSARGCP